MKKVNLAVVGVGNCASSLIQGISYYRNAKQEEVSGLMHWDIAGYKPMDIEVVAAFDVDKRKVGAPLSKAIFASPNNTAVFCKDISSPDVTVQMGCILDGISEHFSEYHEKSAFRISDQKEPTQSEVIQILKKTGVEVLVNYLPVGSEKASQFYMECALEAGLGVVNCVPVFIASRPEWIKKFKAKQLPIIGDDIKSQFGATITHRVLMDLLIKRGIKIVNTYQLNVGGNTDFLNMLNHSRLKSKKVSKTTAVQSVLTQKLDEENIHIGPSDYVPWLKDNKLCFLRIEGKLFGDVPMNVELRLSVEDSPNSAGVVIDAIRCCKIGLENKIGGPLYSPSAYFMKHPPKQFVDSISHEMVEDFISGKRRN